MTRDLRIRPAFRGVRHESLFLIDEGFLPPREGPFLHLSIEQHIPGTPTVGETLMIELAEHPDVALIRVAQNRRDAQMEVLSFPGSTNRGYQPPSRVRSHSWTSISIGNAGWGTQGRHGATQLCRYVQV